MPAKWVEFQVPSSFQKPQRQSRGVLRRSRFGRRMSASEFVVKSVLVVSEWDAYKVNNSEGPQ